VLYVQGFLRKQSEEASPIEFLQLMIGHAQIKDLITKQWPKISSDLQDDKDLMKLNGKPIIIVNETNAGLKDTQGLKTSIRNVTDKAKGQSLFYMANHDNKGKNFDQSGNFHPFKLKSQIENFHLSQKFNGSKDYSSKFRETLFN
jgi:hypothetical protein